MPHLIIKDREGSRRVFALDKEVITIGKDNPGEGIQNHVNLYDETVSRRHAKITKEGDNYFVEDLGSTNHTFVNGQEVKRVKLTPGDRILIGFHTLIFEEDDADCVNPLDLLVKFQELDRNKTLDLNYMVLHQISEKLATVTDLEGFLESVVDTVCATIQAEKCLLLLLEDDGEFHCHVMRGVDNSYSKTTVERVRYEKRGVITPLEVKSTDTFNPLEVTRKTRTYRSIQSLLCAPILKYDEVIGIIYLEDTKPGRFSRSDLILLTAIGNHISSSLERVILSERIKREALLRGNLERFLPPHLAAKMTKVSMDTGKQILKAEKVLATALFLDIKGFTAFSKTLSPAEIMELLDEHFSMMTEIIFKYDGTLINYVGNALKAVFGTPLSYPHHAKNAMLAATEMWEEQRKFKERLVQRKKFDIRIGVSTGEVIAGCVGSLKRMEYILFGEAVILAKRLASLAEPGSLLISRQTYELVKTQYPMGFVQKIRASGDEEDIEVYRVIMK